MAVYNTSSTDDGTANARKCENSLFLSQERDENATKVCFRVGIECVGLDFVVLPVKHDMDRMSYRKVRKNR